MTIHEITNTILEGDCIQLLDTLPENSFDMIFADPPYFLQLDRDLYRPNQTKVDSVDEAWDRFDSFEDYDNFTLRWLNGCRRAMKDDATIWVIGSYHNIFRVGKIMQDIGFWILNDVIWVKANPMPNFNGVRFTNAHETMIWAKKSRGQKRYTFNYQAMKMLNGEKQMRSDWELPICSGSERERNGGGKAHPTQKPESLLRRAILASTNPGDIILDPFFGTGTTGAAAKKLGRNWVGLERNAEYIATARSRIDSISGALPDRELYHTPSRRDFPRVTLGNLIEAGYLHEGDLLCGGGGKASAKVCADGSLIADGFRGSIHRAGAHVQSARQCNGWVFWNYSDGGELRPLDELREKYVREIIPADSEKQGEGSV
jgi:modification methylase